jgi:excisionase family DNA binding protein
MEIADKGYMTQKEVAAVLGVSPSTVRNMIKDGRIRGVVLSKRPMISSAAVRRLLEQGNEPSTDLEAWATESTTSTN